ncbi:MAG: hypothetical protein QNJ40_09600 [Xanthomonadales bacterium]|nr:hypothetical protein [Xanthomonadales bacterium]
MSYQAAINELNKNLELYIKAKCDPAVQNLSKAMYQLVVALEQDLKDQKKQIAQLQATLESRSR